MTMAHRRPGGFRSLPRAGRLVRNAVALMISSAGTAVLGVVFWGIAAHIASPSTIGRASAEIAAMTLLATISQLSFGPIFERFLPVAGGRTRAFVSRAYAMCVSFAFVAAIIYLSLGFGHRFIPASFGARALFVVAVVLWTIFVLQDWVLISLRASRWVPVENILFALAKLALLPAFVAVTESQGIFLAWTIPVVVAVGAVSRFLFRRFIPAHAASSPSSEKLPSVREIVFLAFAQYTTLLVSVFSATLIPLIVIQRLGAAANAHYYLPALISSGVAFLLWNVESSYLVEASSDPADLRRHANSAIRMALVVLLPSIAVGEIFAPYILQIFGATYVVHGTTLLRLLLLSLPGTAVTAFYSAFAWLDKRVWWLAGRQLVSATIYFVVLFSFIGHVGILAVGFASLVSTGIQGIFFLPVSVRRYRMIGRSDTQRGSTGPPPSLAPEL
jgi:O-antigen/teichoic acid export membrane protein